ncbi:hypothetical protein ACQEU3_41305 [Spirillospora sp. CA-253888]
MSPKIVLLMLAGVVVLVAVNVWPVYETYTYVKDDRATARIESCSRNGRSKSCKVTWRTPDGRHGTASTSTGSRGQEIPVRLTPRGGVRRVDEYFFLVGYIFPLTALGTIGGIVVGMRRLGHRARRLAEELLKAGRGTVLRVQDDLVLRKDGEPVMRSRWSERPARHRPEELPERLALKEGGRPTRAPRGDREFMTVADAAGTPLFVAHRRGGQGRAADLCVLAPDGSARAVLQRPSGDVPGGRIVDVTGRFVGSLVAESRSSVWAFSVKDENGVRAGALARNGSRDWVLQLDDDTPQILRDTALAAVLDFSWLRSMQ